MVAPKIEILLCGHIILHTHWLVRFPILDVHNHYSGFLTMHLKGQIVKYIRLFAKVLKSDLHIKFLEDTLGVRQEALKVELVRALNKLSSLGSTTKS